MRYLSFKTIDTLSNLHFDSSFPLSIISVDSSLNSKIRDSLQSACHEACHWLLCIKQELVFARTEKKYVDVSLMLLPYSQLDPDICCKRMNRVELKHSGMTPRTEWLELGPSSGVEVVPQTISALMLWPPAVPRIVRFIWNNSLLFNFD